MVFKKSTSRYKERKEFKNIECDAQIWRYFNYKKFRSLLTESSLFFSRCDKFSDKYEGKWPTKNIQFHINAFSEEDERIINLNRRRIIDASEEILKQMYINCFSIGDCDVKEMWENYCTLNQGIVIKSTFKNLKRAINYPDNIDSSFPDVYIGKISYIDHENEHIPDWTIFCPFLFKKKKFSFENELRLITTWEGLDSLIQQYDTGYIETPENTKIKDLLEPLPKYNGIFIKVDLNILIDEIFVGPRATEEYLSSIKNLVSDTGLNKMVSKSTIK